MGWSDQLPAWLQPTAFDGTWGSFYLVHGIEIIAVAIGFWLGRRSRDW